jgi:hypothetical protein
MLKHTFVAAAVVTMLGAPTVYAVSPEAVSPQDISGSTMVGVPHVISEADLAEQLTQMGYSDVRLTQARPNDIDPRPDLHGSANNSATSLNSSKVAVHSGWNGTAVHQNKRVNILVDDTGPMTEK